MNMHNCIDCRKCMMYRFSGILKFPRFLLYIRLVSCIFEELYKHGWIYSIVYFSLVLFSRY